MGPGSVLAGRFEIQRTLARGGMAEIFEAIDERGQRVAIKLLRAGLSKDDEVLIRFQREARTVAALTSRHVVRVYEVGSTDKDRPFIVMECLDGRDLAKELRKRRTIPVEEAASYVAQTCHAMIEAHEAGVVHRDLKPPNLFLAGDGDARVLKVLDFGISKLTKSGDGHQTLTSALFGSPPYMSPETFRSAKAADERSDVWSVGVIFYEMLTGVTPFAADNAMGVGLRVTREDFAPPSAKRHELPRSTDVVIGRALKKNPSERYQSMRELLAAIEVYLPRGRNNTMTMAQVIIDDATTQNDDEPRTLKHTDVRTEVRMTPPPVDVADDPTDAPTRVVADPFDLPTNVRPRLVGSAEPSSGAETQSTNPPLPSSETGRLAPVSVTTSPKSPPRKIPAAVWAGALVAVLFGIGGFLLGHRGDEVAPAKTGTPVEAIAPASSAPLGDITASAHEAAVPASPTPSVAPTASASASARATASASASAAPSASAKAPKYKWKKPRYQPGAL